MEFIIYLILLAVCLAVCALHTNRMRKNMEAKIQSLIGHETENRKDSIRLVTDFLAEATKTGDTDLLDRIVDLENVAKALAVRIESLENGTVPDFEQAKAAAKAVNDFNKGISAIMGYDPFEARRKAQEERGVNN